VNVSRRFQVGIDCNKHSNSLSYLQHKHAFLERQNDKYMLNSIYVSHIKFYIFNKICIFF
jgi:hypothetical protein